MLIISDRVSLTSWNSRSRNMWYKDPLDDFRDPQGAGVSPPRDQTLTQVNVTPTRLVPRDSRSLPNANRMGGRSLSTDSVYTIVIKLPGETNEGQTCNNVPSIKMIPEGTPKPGRQQMDGEYALGTGAHANHFRRPSAMPDIRIPLNAKIIPKQLAGGKTLLANATKNQGKKKKKTQEKKADKKAAKTLSAILLTFIITWTPYNILVLLKPVTTDPDYRIPDKLWDFFYYLCYINSTINPMCYALCNASFRRTYLRILQCKWHNRNRVAMNRGFYNWN